MPWLEIIGWIGSGLVVWSLMVARVTKFRWMNLAGSSIAAAYNGVIGVWPFMAMNAIIAVIDIFNVSIDQFICKSSLFDSSIF